MIDVVDLESVKGNPDLKKTADQPVDGHQTESV